jgi:hypothetical protein
MWSYAALWRNGPTGARWCVAYFAAMETLQAFQYSWIDKCDDQTNKILTMLGFLHLAFQPFFANMYLAEFMATQKQRRYVPLILAMALFGGILSMNRMWLSPGDIHCAVGVEPMCGIKTCTFRGDVHLAWQAPMQHADQDYFTPGFQLHFFMFYLPTFALGMWPMTLFLLASGPFLGRALTAHQDEIPAIWCFFSIAQLFFPLIYAKLTKTAMFAPVDQKVKEEDEEEPVTYKSMFIRGSILFACLTLKRYATIYMNGYTDATGLTVPKPFTL